MVVTLPAPASRSRPSPRARRVAILAVFLAAGTASAEVEVRATADRGYNIKAKSAPLNEVVDRLAAITGTKVSCDGPVPREIVNLGFEAASAPEAFYRLLEGHGLAYGMRFDASGLRVELLLITGRAGTTQGGPAVTASRSAPVRPPIATTEPPEDFVEAPPPDDVQAPEGQPGVPPIVALPMVPPAANAGSGAPEQGGGASSAGPPAVGPATATPPWGTGSLPMWNPNSMPGGVPYGPQPSTPTPAPSPAPGTSPTP